MTDRIFSQTFLFFLKTTYIIILKLVQIVHMKELNQLVTHVHKTHAPAHTFSYTHAYTLTQKIG